MDTNEGLFKLFTNTPKQTNKHLDTHILTHTFKAQPPKQNEEKRIK